VAKFINFGAHEPEKLASAYENWIVLYLIQSGWIYWNKTWWLWDFMAPSLFLITWFLNPKAYPINNLSLTMVSKQKSPFFFRHHMWGYRHYSFTSHCLVRLQLECITSTEDLKIVPHFLHVFLTKYSLQDIYGQVFLTMHNIECVSYH